jgi:hypothetical protein
MTKSGQSAQLRSRLEALDNALETSSLGGNAVPVSRKINEGNDRYGGYP